MLAEHREGAALAGLGDPLLPEGHERLVGQRERQAFGQSAGVKSVPGVGPQLVGVWLRERRHGASLAQLE